MMIYFTKNFNLEYFNPCLSSRRESYPSKLFSIMTVMAMTMAMAMLILHPLIQTICIYLLQGRPQRHFISIIFLLLATCIFVQIVCNKCFKLIEYLINAFSIKTYLILLTLQILNLPFQHLIQGKMVSH